MNGKQTHRGIPADKIDRYRKLWAMADDAAAAPNERTTAKKQLVRMETKYPGIADALQELKTFEARVQDASTGRAEAVQGDRPFSVYDAIAMFEQYTKQNPADWFVDRVFRDGVNWGIDQLRNASLGEDGMPRTLEDELDELYEMDEWEIEPVRIANWEDDGDDQIGKDCVQVSFLMPEATWNRIVHDPAKGKAFLRWMDDMLAGEDEEAEEAS